MDLWSCGLQLLGKSPDQMVSLSGNRRSRGGERGGREKVIIVTEENGGVETPTVRVEEVGVGWERINTKTARGCKPPVRVERRTREREEIAKGAGREDKRKNTGIVIESKFERGAAERQDVSFWTTLQSLTGSLVGQGFSRRFTMTSSSRLVVGVWLVFAYVVTSVYNGNLTATLTVPTYPPRPETLAELVVATDR